MQLEQICPNMHSIEFRRKIPNIEMLTPKALGPTLQLPLLHGINCRNSKTLVPFTASAAAFRSTNPYARCYSRSAISGGSPSGGLTGTRLGVLYSFWPCTDLHYCKLCAVGCNGRRAAGQGPLRWTVWTLRPPDKLSAGMPGGDSPCVGHVV